MTTHNSFLSLILMAMIFLEIKTSSDIITDSTGLCTITGEAPKKVYIFTDKIFYFSKLERMMNNKIIKINNK